MQCDLLIRNGTIVDGSGSPAFRGEVAVKDGRIISVAKIGVNNEKEWETDRVIHADNLTVCPGFIDVHSHSDFLLPLKDHPERLACTLEQGITTIVAGNCGFSAAPLVDGSRYISLVQADFDLICDSPVDIIWTSIGSFFNLLETNGLSLNLAQLTGHGLLRNSLWGTDYRMQNQEQMEHMLRIIEESFDEGAYGVSLGLGYVPGMYAAMEELEGIARLVKKYNRMLTVHTKSLVRLAPTYSSEFMKKHHNIRALEDMIRLAEKTGVKIQISHLPFLGKKTWSSCDLALQMIDKARSNGINIAFDIFPYHLGNSTVEAMFPPWFLRDKEKNFGSFISKLFTSFGWSIGCKINGMDMGDIQLMQGRNPELEKYDALFIPEIARKMNCSNNEAYFRICQMSRGNALCLFHKFNGEEDNDEVLTKVMKHHLCTFETDALVTSGKKQNPAAIGAFPRVIQRYHKEKNLFSLEEAIAKMTGKSAKRFALINRGFIKAGCWADITLFDYDLIDTSTSTDKQKPSGIEYVFINGHEVVRNGNAIKGIRCGQVLRCG